MSGDGRDLPQHQPKTEPQDNNYDDDDALFGDIDPRQLANILVEALRNKNKDVREDSSVVDEESQEQDTRTDSKRQDEDEDFEETTEDVTSRTFVTAVEAQTKKPSTAVEEPKSGATSRSEEVGQLTEEELHNLETMMKEFPRVGAFGKRDDSNSFNEILPVNKNLEQRRKWQEETMKGLNFPSFSYVDELEKVNSLTSPQNEDTEETQPEEEESQEQVEEEVLSPEEEEARVKAEQDEMRRQAAEAQRARMEEEKLADIASDMLLRYMGKERNGNQGKYRRPLSDAPEDKRSDEQPQDLDPQTIDKLIEISSKLHLPADDVVDIISDVEKKKRKDVIPEAPPVNNQPFPSATRTWFHPKMAPPPQDLWSKPRKVQPMLWTHQSPKPWLKPQVYPLPYYYRRPAYYPLPLVVPPRPLPWFYNPKPYALNRYLMTPLSYPPNSRAYPAPVNWRLLRKPVPYYTDSAPLWRFKLKAPPSRPVTQQKQWLAPIPAVAKEANRGSQKASDMSNRRDNLERYIQQLVLNKAHMLD